MVTGRVERGQIKVGEEVAIIGMREEIKKHIVTGVENGSENYWTMRRPETTSEPCLRGLDRKDVERGMVLAKPNSIKPLNRIPC